MISKTLTLFLLLLSTSLFAGVKGDPREKPSTDAPVNLEDCNQSVSDTVSSWAEEMKNISTSSVCEKGNLKSGNCEVQGFDINKTCGNVSPEQLIEIAQGVRNIKGKSGLGCLNSVNSGLAQGMVDFFKNPNMEFCCGSCDGIADTDPGMSCAANFKKSSGGKQYIVLNINRLSDKHFCGERYSKPIEATMFHEMLHASGVSGVHFHSSRDFKHPHTGMSMDERDVLADPVYGCENFCYGKKNYSHSATCLACASGEPGRDENNIDPTTSFNYLSDRLEKVWGMAAVNDPKVPKACSQLWKKGDKEAGQKVAVATIETRKISELSDEMDNCSKEVKKYRYNEMLPLTEKCGKMLKELRESCSRFGTAVTVKDQCIGSKQFYAFQTKEVLAKCRGAEVSFLNTFEIMVGSAKDKSKINCSELFPGTWSACPGLESSYNTPLTSKKCDKAVGK